MIKHHYRLATSLQNSMDFPDRSGSVGCVMQNTMRIDHIERVVRKVEIFSVGSTKFSGKFKQLKPFLCELNSSVS